MTVDSSLTRGPESADDFPAVPIDGDLVYANGVDPDAVIAVLGGR